jgi:pilus assembly protein CpaC
MRTLPVLALLLGLAPGFGLAQAPAQPGQAPPPQVPGFGNLPQSGQGMPMLFEHPLQRQRGAGGQQQGGQPAPAAPAAPGFAPQVGGGSAPVTQMLTTRPQGYVPPPDGPAPIALRIESGTGRLLQLPGPAATVMAADPRVARVQPASPTSVFVMAVSAGRTTVIATTDSGQAVAEYDITVLGRTEPVAPGTAGPAGPATVRAATAGQVESQLRALLTGPSQVRVRIAGRTMVLSGTVASAADARRAEAIARGMAAEGAEVLNELAVLSSIQVNLRVRVAEISRDVTRQFGFNWQAIGTVGNFTFGLRSGAASGLLNTAITGAAGGLGTLGSPQRLGGAYRSGGTDVNGLIDALALDNLVTILAEPNLTAQSGEVASFLAGGEFPIPVAARDGQISIEFKSFGVSLAFIPTVLSGDRLALRVRPEVSELSDQGSINLPVAGGSLRIPGLTVRRAETTIELGSGQSFAIAGLLQRSTSQTTDGLNGLGDLPVLGALFRSDRFQRRETELVIIVTPYLVQPVSDPGMLAAPTDGFRPATSLDRILHQRQMQSGRPPGRAPDGVGFRFE